MKRMPILKYNRIADIKIIDDYDNVTVGKLLLELLRYMQAKELIADEDKETFRKCAENAHILQKIMQNCAEKLVLLA